MRTTITSKYQTTIPKGIREKLGLSVHDALEWSLKNGTIMVKPKKPGFSRFRNTVRIGSGDIKRDINKARKLRASRIYTGTES
ncbi:MAG: AbrB family transcriptional regulator [Deltaproteobacteria bacterium]|nr:MAG: AbrB family transcriptional regulator [Deltaproteobacteria bacterium]